MKLLGLEITKAESDSETTLVVCCHCAKKFVIGVKNVRASNYCFNCK
jgi:hypothetical protein